MQQLTPTGQNIVNDLSYRYNLSQDAVIHMIIAVNNGGGTMAQFNCPELGGSGQWMQGGMTMVGDMFNYGLKNTVNNLCAEISNLLLNNQIFPPISNNNGMNQNNWWIYDLGIPFSSGSQNNIRYAVFPNRLAIDFNGQVTVYDTLNHQISGVSQQQGNDYNLTFSSQFGTISVSSLPIVYGNSSISTTQTNFAQPQPQTLPVEMDSYSNQTTNNNLHGSVDSMIQSLEKLAKLKDAGIISESEFNTTKQKLLNNL